MGVAGGDKVKVNVYRTRGVLASWRGNDRPACQRLAARRRGYGGVDDAQYPSILVFLLPFDADGFAADQGREIGRRFLGARVSALTIHNSPSATARLSRRTDGSHITNRRGLYR